MYVVYYYDENWTWTTPGEPRAVFGPFDSFSDAHTWMVNDPAHDPKQFPGEFTILPIRKPPTE